MYQSIDSHPEPPLSHCRIVVFSIIALSLLIFSIYGNSFDCSWHFDDDPNITDNPNLHLKEITWQNLKRALFSDRNNPAYPYRPMACLTFALNHYFGGLNVFGYHLVNILIHLISSVFLFLFIYHTLNLASLKAKYARQSYFIALLATTLWAINPVQTQAVTYIVQRMASLAGMFYIMSMFFYLKARRSETGSKKIIFFILCFVSFLMALGSKENAAILPLSLFLYEIVILQEDAGSYLRRNRGVFLIVCGGTLLLGLLYMYFKGGNIFSFLNGYENRPFTLTQRLLTQPRVTIFYFSLLLYPVPNRLSIAHSFQVSTSLFDPISTIFSILLISGAIAFAIYSAKKNPLFSFCILFFFLNHAIESSILPLELIFEHRNYIPSMLFFLPIAIGFYNLLQLYTKKKAMKHIISAFIILLLIGVGHATFMRNFTWKNERNLWMDAIEKSPDLFRPHHNLGKYYHDHGHKNEAILEYQKAIEKPVTNRIDETSVTYYNLAKIYSDFKDYEKALYHYYKALFINPQFPPIYNDIAGVFDRQGKYELAYRYLVEAFRLWPYSTVTNFNLGLYYLRERQPEKALYHLQSLSDEKEFGDKVLIYLGVAFKQKGQLGRAVTYFKKALKANPRNIKLYLHLAEIFYRIGDNQHARRQAAKAIDLIPDKAAFRRILDDLQKRGPLKNLQPQAAIVVPLMRECCRSKSETLKEWNELLNEKSLKFEGE
ncbi:MAG: tetratricopeptide repeat protein [Deltaproteobacteria bacterium]|nr:MAG: tetratricopeptide repeat protein [Deltaproteobacteria bacterium]